MNIEKLKNSSQWFSSQRVPLETSFVSATRDVFQARSDHFYNEYFRETNDKGAPLLSAIVGELGNNCFDHNLGQWNDVPGCWFDYQIGNTETWVLIADRGQGILSSLKRVKPSLITDQAAVELAFEKKISGRSPEHRGNGLKFVRNALNNNPGRALFFNSGEGKIYLGGLKIPLNSEAQKIIENQRGAGAFALIFWRKS